MAKPLPTHLKVVKGTARKGRVREDEPTYDGIDVTDLPDTLTPEGRKAWEQNAQMLKDAGVLKTIDRAALTQLCDAMGTYADAHAAIAKSGYFIKSPNGMPMLSPAVYLRNGASATVQKLLAEFGMTPSSRTKVGSDKPKKRGDDWDDF